MNTLFADTSYYIAYTNPRDKLHQFAHEIAEKNKCRIVTTEYVLVELANYHCSPSNRTFIYRFLTALRSDPNTQIIPASESYFHRGLEFFNQRPDKSWSLTDCISFAVMRHYRITDALTCDHHFAQAGFHVLLEK